MNIKLKKTIRIFVAAMRGIYATAAFIFCWAMLYVHVIPVQWARFVVFALYVGAAMILFRLYFLLSERIPFARKAVIAFHSAIGLITVVSLVVMTAISTSPLRQKPAEALAWFVLWAFVAAFPVWFLTRPFAKEYFSR